MTRSVYFVPNIIQETDLNYLSQSWWLYLTWHLPTLDVSLISRGWMPLSRARNIEINGALNLTVRLTNNFALVSSANVRYRNSPLNQPYENIIDNPFFQYVSGGDYLPFTYGGNFAFEFTFGNAGLRVQDQRWVH